MSQKGTENKKPVQATKLEYLEWFYQRADFGPGDGDVRAIMKEQFQEETGKSLPEGYNDEE